jgi:hypothetical protein
MLLGHHLSVMPPSGFTDAACGAWRHRQHVELQAAWLFGDLAARLEALAVGPALTAMALRAASDERRHAVRCVEIVSHLGGDSAGAAVPAPMRLGPANLDQRQRALFTSVALCCVTETLSTALLMEMRTRVTNPMVRRTVHDILRDEVRHARLGWAHLAIESRQTDVTWLAAHLPGMLRAALRDDVAPSTMDDPPEDLAALGILPRREVLRVVRAAADEVLVPGLERFDIDTRSTREAVAALTV